MARVVLEHLTKHFEGPAGKIIRAVEDASLTLEQGELLVIAGPSGCGKTTTLRLIAGLEKPTSGTIAMDGSVVNDVPPGKRDVAMVFQHYALYPDMTAYENMAFGPRLRKYPRAEVDQRVREAAQMLGLNDCLDRKPASLSGGQRQRVALGRALARRPAVFLLDEPLSNLDLPMRSRMRTELARLHARLKTTMIYVTHDQTEAMTLGQRIAMMCDGTIQQIAEPLTLYRRPANLFVAGFFGSPAMNFFTGRINQESHGLLFKTRTTDGEVQTEGLSLEVEPGTIASDCAGRQVILGIRPEHVLEASSAGKVPSANLVQGVTEAVEPVGPETYLHVRRGGHVFTARIKPDTPTVVNEPVAMAFDMGGALFFDPETGSRISR